MNIYGNTEIESSDADLLYYHTQVEEDGIITGPDAVNVIAHGENNDAYQRIRTAVHEQYHPRNTYQHILADRIADTIWRAERFAAFETTAFSLQTAQDRAETTKRYPHATTSLVTWLAWQNMDTTQRKALQEALKLEDRAWRRHRALSNELRLIQKTFVQ
ncbi:hypothetical protein [uncultured Paludibaculum sp.]|uniref:hypothetical protein n=1 Tax=uncultured Paludibaculum sp. TaxID=1765020 RepID=UPI002AAB413D|nr:hypothetical protein [uncultured Paludibaculum sp.]